MLDASDTPSLLRRCASILYDSLLLCGLLFLAGMPLPLIPEDIRALWGIQLLIQIYLVLTCVLFFVWFWRHGGQTLGMRVWRLKLVNIEGTAVSRRAAWIRGVSAVLSWAAIGLGFVWVLIDPEGRAWHDRLSCTKLILLPKAEKSGKRDRFIFPAKK